MFEADSGEIVSGDTFPRFGSRPNFSIRMGDRPLGVNVTESGQRVSRFSLALPAVVGPIKLTPPRLNLFDLNIDKV
jgi:hypothetical protein